MRTGDSPGAWGGESDSRLELFRILVEQIREYAIFLLDPGGRVASWNAGAQRITGYAPDEVIGEPLGLFYPPEDAAVSHPDQSLQRAAAAGVYEEEGWRLRKDGTRFWAGVVITAVRDERGLLRGFTKLTRDLTAHREAEEAIRRSQESLAVTLRSIGDALIATDEAGRVTLMNPVAARLTGWSAEEAVGRPLDEVFRIVNENTRAAVESPVPHVLREGRIVGLANHTLLIARDGAEHPIADSAAPIRADGSVRGVVLIFRDQTAERAAERALRESEERFRLLVEGVREYALFMLEPDGRVASWNPGAERIKGYTAAEIVGQHFSRFYTPEDAAAGKPARLLREAAQAGKVEDEGWRVRKNGTRFWANVVITALHDHEGRLRGYGKLTRDMSERRAAEEHERALIREQAARAAAEASAAERRESAERYRQLSERLDAVLEGVEDGITMQEASGKLAFANAAAARIAGYASPQEMIAASPSEFAQRFQLFGTDGKPLSYDRAPGRRTLASGRPESELIRVYEGATGRSWWSAIRARPVLGPGGEPEAVVSIWRDVTEQRRREELLHVLADAGNLLASSLDYGATVSQVAALLVPRLADWCGVDILEDGRLRSVAVAHVDPAKVALARDLQQRFPPDPNLPRGVYEVIRSGRSELYPEITDELLDQGTPDPEQRRILRELGLRSALCVPLATFGRPFGALTLIAAESGRRYDEADLAGAEELARRVALAIESARLFREVQQAVRVRDDFLSIAGHELKTPLTALTLQLQGLQRLARRGGGALDDKRLGDRLGKASAFADRLEELVRELLDVSRITAGRLQLDRREQDLAVIVRSVAERSADALAEAKCPLTVEAPKPVTGQWDRLRLDQVVTNLLSNAIKYGRGRPILVRVEARPGTAVLTVQDQGIGIEPNQQARIFDRFERAVSEHHYGGFGLGLWIVRQIVEGHGGTVQLDSKPGQGATFTVELPRRPPPTAGDHPRR